MESLKQTIAELSKQFNTRMDDFQLQFSNKSVSTPGSILDLAAQFTAFKTFILTALSSLQQQVDILAHELDRQEMRNRRKFLLVHGVPEGKNEDSTEVVTKIFTDSLHSDFTFSSEFIVRSHRMGRYTNKPRPIIVKFKDIMVRDKVWFSKTALKGSGVTLSEFLTKIRHDTFLAARQRFGVSKCWTKNGNIIVVGPDGKKVNIQTMADLNRVPTASETEVQSLQSASHLKVPEDKTSRSKRIKK